MKTRRHACTCVSIVVLAWSAAALASPPQGVEGGALELDPVTAEHTGTGPDSLVIDCSRVATPSQGQFARLAGIANQSQAYAARARLMANVQRACQRADAVRVVGVSQRPSNGALARVTP